MKAINPATEEVLDEYPELSSDEARERLERAVAAFASWRRTSFDERAAKMRRVGELLRDGERRYGRLITQEMGKPIAAAEAEVEKCAWVCDFYADHAAELLAPEPSETDASESFVRFDPLGAVLAIMPWNFPFWQVMRFAAPTLMGGNVGLLKHAPNVPGCAHAIEELFHEAGFPEGAFTNLPIDVDIVPEIIAHPGLRAVTLTGSERAGEAVASEAGKRLKPTLLELGGSDPFIVLADADPEEVAGQAVKARMNNSGQSCIAAKRFIVEDPLADAFEQAFTERMRSLRVGDPMERDTHVGPLARLDLLEGLHDQVERSVEAGAELVAGGERLDRRGFFYAPTVLRGVEPGMAAFDEETFGPVGALIRARDAGHAVELANRSTFGLGASIWTGNTARARELVPEIEAGSVYVNGVVRSDPRLPFGGIKRSGYGRELAREGIRAFVNVKTVWIK